MRIHDHLLPLAAAITVMAGIAPAGRAKAYEAHTHQEMTRAAVDLMRLVAYQESGAHPPTNPLIPQGETSLWTPPAGIDPAQWHQFLSEVSEGMWRVLGADAGLPSTSHCADMTGLRMFELPNINPSSSQQIGFHFQYLHKHRIGDKMCRQDEKASRLVQNLNEAFPHGELAGSALGVHAADPDYALDDWAVFFNPIATGGVGAVVDLVNDASTNVGAVFIAPIYCAYKFFSDFELCSKDDLLDFAERTNPLPEIEGILAAPFGLGSFHKESLTGLGHLLNFSPGGRHDTYDDIGGYYQEHSGWRGTTGIVDQALTLAFDLTGITIEPRDSNGARNYEICDGSGLCDKNEVLDNHAPSHRRTNTRWRSVTLGHTEFTPLDNLAYFGWRRALNSNFPEAPPAVFTRIEGIELADLALPLHAMGDSAAPHHMIAGLGWGHRPYEVMVDRRWDSVQTYDTGTDVEQYRNARTILMGAFFWHNYIKDWRESFHPNNARDIPIRDLVSAMAARNYSYIISGSEDTHGDFRHLPRLEDLPPSAFPYKNIVHARPGKALDFVIDDWIDSNAEQIGHLINNSIAGSVAFISSASESMDETYCGDGMVRAAKGEECDDANDASGDGCFQCKLEPVGTCDTHWPTRCKDLCGNGTRNVNEDCDDGNGTSGDGCSAACFFEVI